MQISEALYLPSKKYQTEPKTLELHDKNGFHRKSGARTISLLYHTPVGSTTIPIFLRENSEIGKITLFL